jgi:hypothetical protein
MNTAHSSSAMPMPTLSAQELERLARRRAGAKYGWLVHAMVYVSVNALLIGLSIFQGKVWAVYPLLGWGLGLALHGAAVWLGGSGSGLHQRLLHAERAKLAKLASLEPQRDPW